MIVGGKVALIVLLVAAGLGFVIALAQSPAAGGAGGDATVYEAVVIVGNAPVEKPE